MKKEGYLRPGQISWVVWAGLTSGVSFLMFSFFFLFGVSKLFHVWDDVLPSMQLVLNLSGLARQFWPLYALAMLSLYGMTWRYLLYGRSAAGRRVVWIGCWLVLAAVVVWSVFLLPPVV